MTSAVSADPLQAWEAVIAHLEEARELSLVSIYQQAKVLSWTDAGVEIGYPPGMSGELASEPAKVAAMRAHVTRVAGRPMAFQVTMLTDPGSAASARSLPEAQAERQREESTRRQSEAREHPLTKMVLDTFGASIKEIKTDV